MLPLPFLKTHRDQSTKWGREASCSALTLENPVDLFYFACINRHWGKLRSPFNSTHRSISIPSGPVHFQSSLLDKLVQAPLAFHILVPCPFPSPALRAFCGHVLPLSIYPCDRALYPFVASLDVRAHSSPKTHGELALGPRDLQSLRVPSEALYRFSSSQQEGDLPYSSTAPVIRSAHSLSLSSDPQR